LRKRLRRKKRRGKEQSISIGGGIKRKKRTFEQGKKRPWVRKSATGSNADVDRTWW